MDFNNTEEVVEGQLSKINSAGLVNSTMNNLWVDFFRHYRDGKYLSANADLDCIWTILGGEKDMGGSDEETAYFNIELELSKLGKLQDNLEVKGFDKINTQQLNNLGLHKVALLKKSLFLRRLQNSQGKGSAYQSGDDEETE